MTGRAQRLPIEACYLPHTLSAEEAEGYRAVRAAHCAQGRTGHLCAGRLAIDAKGITLSCPLCGDARGLYPTGSKA